MKKVLRNFGSLLTVTISTERGYFSITGAIGSNGPCGCIHKEILAEHPNLHSLVALHLSTVEGVPMHAAANGLYWITGCVDNKLGQRWVPNQSKDICFSYLQSHFRISTLEAQSVITICEQKFVQGGIESVKAYVSDYVESKRDLWKAEANAAITFISTL